MEKEDVICYQLLRNAERHKGKASAKAVLGAVLAQIPELRSDAKSTLAMIEKEAENINRMSIEQISAALEEFGPREERKRTEGLPPLMDNASSEWNGPIVVRFAPGPSGPLHLGHTRALILNDEYVKKYGGRLILRLEDTNPEKVMPEAYQMIEEDVEWLGISAAEIYRQSERMQFYYDHATKLVENGSAYVCTCNVELWREMKNEQRACEHREADSSGEWERLLDGHYSPGEASLVVKTDIRHPNPAVRDFVAMRIRDQPHPITGEEFRVFPTYNFAVAIDDHLMGMTHILRGKDHLNNTIRQKYVYHHLGWDPPVFIHYGWVKMDDTVLKTSDIKWEIASGKMAGWSDVRLGTLRAMKERGITPDAIRALWKEVGTNEVDINFSWDNLYAYNRKIIDDDAPRAFFVKDPVMLDIESDQTLEMNAPVHPQHPDRGSRTYTLEPDYGRVRVYISREDHKQGTLRLKDLCNIEVTRHMAYYAGNDLSVIKEKKVPIVQAVPATNSLRCLVRMPDGSTVRGYVEDSITVYDLPIMMQFERFGFVNIIEHGRNVIANFAHK